MSDDEQELQEPEAPWELDIPLEGGTPRFSEGGEREGRTARLAIPADFTVEEIDRMEGLLPILVRLLRYHATERDGGDGG